MDEYSVSAFPANKYEALAMLYLKSQDLTGKSPEDLAAIYTEAYQRISKWFSDESYKDVTFL